VWSNLALQSVLRCGCWLLDTDIGQRREQLLPPRSIGIEVGQHLSLLLILECPLLARLIRSPSSGRGLILKHRNILLRASTALYLSTEIEDILLEHDVTDRLVDRRWQLCKPALENAILRELLGWSMSYNSLRLILYLYCDLVVNFQLFQQGVIGAMRIVC
jgi:hypothetical protein